MTKKTYVFYNKEVKQVLTNIFFYALEIFGEHYGDDVPISDLTGNLNEDFRQVLNEVFEERMMEALIEDPHHEEDIDPSILKVVETIKDSGQISAEFIERIGLVTKNGLFIVETSE